MGIKQRFNAFMHPEQIKMNPAFAGMISYSNEPQPIMMPRNYKAYAKEGYRGNDTVYKCVAYISRNGAAIPPVLYTDSTRKKKIEKHPLLDMLNKPNNSQSGIAYRESALSYKLMSGNAYQYAIPQGKNGPAELWVLRPDLVEIVANKSRGITGYKYQFMEAPIAPNLIGHTKYWHPDNDLYGLSPLELAAIFVDMQKAARLWNLALLQNSARPPGAWTVPTALSKNDRDRLQQMLKEKLSGYRNAGTPPILDAGLKWESMGLPPADLDYIPGMQYNSVMIANLYNLAPQLVGDTSSSTYNNVLEMKSASYTEAIFPELDDFYALQSAWLLPMYPDLKGSDAVLGYDKETVEVIQQAIQAQKSAKADRGNKMWVTGQCTLNESRVLSDLPEIPGGDVFRIGGVLVLAADLPKYAEQSLTAPAAPPIPQAEPIQQPGAGQAPTTGKQPSPQPGKKEMDKNGIYQPDDLLKRLAAFQSKGVTYLQWSSSKFACDICKQNDGQIVRVGDAFNSGHILPEAHPNCDCEVIAVSEEDVKKYLEMALHQEAQNILSQQNILPQRNDVVWSSREEYKTFMRKLNHVES